MLFLIKIMKPAYPIYCAGEFIATDTELPVIFPYNGETAAKTYLAGTQELEKAIVAGLAAEKAMKNLPSYARSGALLHIAKRLAERKEEFAEAMVLEAGKPLSYARIEADRAAATFTDGAEEAKRLYGEWLPLDRAPNGDKHEATVRRFPLGLVAAIAPFNFPLNLVAHKLAPAIAAGCPIILKPASKTPLSALLLAELIAETELPRGVASILPMDRVTGDKLVTDERFKLLTFTGSPSVGWDMKTRAGKKKIVLELGGNAAVIIAKTADVKKHLKKIVAASFGQSGQSCIHTQRIFVHESQKEFFYPALAEEAKKIAYGDPRDEAAAFSSLIDEASAERIDSWVKEAVAEGAVTLAGGQRLSKTGYAPTVLANAGREMKVCAEEAFAPVVVLEEYHDFKEAVARVNDSRFGLQAGVFTNDLAEAAYAFENLEVGGVMINNVSSFRADSMPYGGVKDSGLGREGVRYAIEDMTERRVLVINKG